MGSGHWHPSMNTRETDPVLVLQEAIWCRSQHQMACLYDGREGMAGCLLGGTQTWQTLNNLSRLLIADFTSLPRSTLIRVSRWGLWWPDQGRDENNCWLTYGL